jgi:membrane associated rhomboid family serine protease
MGIYDREYYREEDRGFFGGGRRSVVLNLVLINVGVFLVQVFTKTNAGDLGWFTDAFTLHADVFRNPLRYYQFLSYGFLHDPTNIGHILFNMIGLWFFGRDLENQYGSRVFLSLYLTMIVVGGLTWGVAERVIDGDPRIFLLGASGGVVGVVVLFAINYPKRIILLWFVLPVPAWILALLLVLGDLNGAIRREDAGNVAYTCHLGGAALALLFYKTGWHLGRFLPGKISLDRLKPGPKLRVHDPEEKEREVNEQVDAILQKIQQQGQESLTRKERRILEDASRRYQQKHR